MKLNKNNAPDRRVLASGALFLIIMLILMTASQAHAQEIQEISPSINNKLNSDGFELPIDGATGYAVAAANIRAESNSKSSKLGTIPAGSMFIIHEDCGQYMRVTYQDNTGQNITGYAVKALVMINLPDVIPSIKYVNSNGTASMFKSSGYDLNNITGRQLYAGKTWNERLGYEEHNMSVLYTMAKKISAAQQTALSDGNCLMLYEAYRPVKIQKQVNVELASLISSNKTVRQNINDGIWGKNWFIAKSLSNHQMGFAIDISLGEIKTIKSLNLNEYGLQIPDEVQEYTMPTAMHELSNKAVALAWPVNSLSKTAWQKVPDSKNMTTASKLLKTYCVDAGMSPLASEWWHFNDLDAREVLKNTAKCSGKFEITGNVSQKIS